MNTTPSGTASPIALQQDEGEALWFLGGLATIKAASATTNGRRRRDRASRPQGGRSAPARSSS
jgi:hypothetical protein